MASESSSRAQRLTTTPGLLQSILRSTFAIVVSISLLFHLLIVWHSFMGALALYYAHLGMVIAIVGLSLINDRMLASLSRNGLIEACIIIGALVIGITASIYLFGAISELEFRQPFITNTDFVIGALLITSVLMLCWFSWGAILTIVMASSIIYFFFGEHMPGTLSHRPPPTEVIMSYLAGMGGARGVLWGIPLSVNTLFLIIVFGGLLRGTRILELFDEIGKLLTGIARAGVCYSSILASSLIGMVTGQAVANVALSGSMTIPSMQQRGLSAEKASTVEVMSSLGSQLLPPIMGLGAFLMAVNLGVPYIDIVTAAVLPAILYMATVVVATYFMAKATPTLITRREPADIGLIFSMLPSFLIAFITLIVLLYMRYSPGYAAFWAIMLLVALSFLRPRRYRPSFRDLFQGVEFGVVAAANLGLILAAIGLIVQVLITTGAGFEIGRIAMRLAGDSVVLALLLGMAISLLVGLGLPTPAAYALIAIIMIPFLIDIGIQPIVAHFFGFYFAIFSAVTPPVAVGCMAAARISSGSFYGTVWECMKFSAVCILIPFSFVAFPSTLAFPEITIEAVTVFVALMLSTALWAASIYGVLRDTLRPSMRVVLLAGPFGYVWMLLTQNIIYALIPISVFILFITLTTTSHGAALAYTSYNRK